MDLMEHFLMFVERLIARESLFVEESIHPFDVLVFLPRDLGEGIKA